MSGLAAAVEIPFQPQPQVLTITLNGTDYVLTTRWNAYATALGSTGTWILDIADDNLNPLVTGLALVTGVNLLEQYDYLGIGGYGSKLIVYSDQNVAAVPQYADLGITGHVVFIPPPVT